MATWKVVPYKKFPILESTSWDGDEADMNMRKWASSDGSGEPDKMNWGKYRQGFTSYDADAPENFGSYKFPHHNIADGEMVTDREGVFTAYAFLDRADMPQNVIDGMRSHLDKHYEDMGLKPPSEREVMMYMDQFEAGPIIQRGLGPILSVGFRLQGGDPGMYANESAELAKLFSERVGISTDGIYIFPLQPSTQALDSYFTRQSASSLQNYAKNAQDGVPFMNSHRTGGCTEYAEWPLGQSFDGRLVGNPVDESPILRRDEMPEPDSIDLLDTGLRLQTWDYMKEGAHPNGNGQPGTDDAIAAIASKTLRQVSIGFGNPSGGRMSYQCGLCGNPVGRRGMEDETLNCDHVPGFRSKDTGHIAFAWVMNGRMYEHSGVWAGATPGAVVGSAPRQLIAQARMVAARGGLTSEEIDQAEALYGGVKIRQGTQFAVSKKPKENEIVEDEKEVNELRDEGLVEQEPCGKTEVRSVKQQLDGIEAALVESNKLMAENNRSVLRVLEELAKREVGETVVTLEADGIEDAMRALDERLERLETVVEKVEGNQEATLSVRDLLVKRGLEAAVRANGQFEVNTKRLQKMWDRLTIEELQEEIEALEQRNPFEARRAVINPEEKTSGGYAGRHDDPDMYKVG